ncbi:lysophospholipid acyltransferase family protein [Jidongwangia harbinensis]|uniref:lysophospholipid acyltransferase family protein n=1 Tax=Jidongwangia harbinensis TaxID=2878561 RepID=UPI001CDA54A0|nr:lysophospholipid acyltransferase family protein [Jidongwangia harbinensis]
MTLAGVLVLGLLLVPLLRGRAVRPLARAVLASLGVRVRGRGPAVRPGSLLVANHVSWLDVVALLASAPVRPVAKREVRGWPGIGGLAGAAGAIFVDRSRPKSLPGTVAEVTAALRAGRSVAVFPEGTTFCGATRGAFRPAMFQAAVDAGAPVLPLAITYDSPAAAFVGDDTLWSSVRRVATLRGLTVTLAGGPALHPVADADRRMVARAAQASVGLTPAALDLAA